MNIQFVVDMWIDIKRDEDNDFLITFCDDNGNSFCAVIKSKDKRYLKELIKSCGGVLDG